MEKNKNKETDFQGAVSLDAIFAAKQGKPIDTGIKEETKPVEKIESKKEEVIENKEVVTEQPKPTTTIPEAIKQEPVETEAFKTAKRLIKLGVLKDFAIQISDEDEEGILISEFSNMTDENLEEIVKIHEQETKKEISEKYLPKGDLKEHQLKVFEILSNGGDLSQIAETPDKALERPFEGFDMDDQKKQAEVLYVDLVSGKNYEHDDAILRINREIKNGTIAKTSQNIFDAYRDAHTKYIDDILEKQRKEKEFKDLNFKENKKLLTSKLKEAGLKESVYKKVASEYSNKNENGDFVLVDKLREALNNPEENYELILHLADKNLFNETYKIKASTETQKAIVRLASGAAMKGNKKSQKTQDTKQDSPWGKYAEAYNQSIKSNQ
jgi:hypothetical protein